MAKSTAGSQLAIMAGLRLRCVRDAFDARAPMKQEEFAQRLGVGRTALANWEAGRALPDVAAMVRLSDWLGIPLEWVFQGQTRHIERDVAVRLEQRAIGLGATVAGMPTKGERDFSTQAAE